MLSGLGLRTVTCDGNPQLPNACGANNQSSPLVCLSYMWNCWCLGFLLQWTSTVGMLNSQILTPSLPGCLQWFADHTSGCSCFGIWSCRSDWNQELRTASAKAFVLSFFPLATRSKLWSCPGCVCRMWDGGGGGSRGVSAVLNKQAMQMWMEGGKVDYCSTWSLCSGRWGNWEKETELVWNSFKPADTQFPSHSHYSQLSLSANLHVIKNVGWWQKELYKVMLKDIPLCAFDATSGMRL